MSSMLASTTLNDGADRGCADGIVASPNGLSSDVQRADGTRRRRILYPMPVPDRFSRGSSRSRSPSPRRLMPSTVKKMHRPGNSASHQDVLMYVRPSASMLPQVGISGGTPSPRKLSDASEMMADA